MGETLSIRLLGSLDLRLDGRALPPLGSTRAESLLAYLLLNRDAPQPREHLAFKLWPDSTEPQARTNLRHVLHNLKRALPDADRFLDVQARTVQWHGGALTWLDTTEFDAALTRAENHDHAGDPVEAIASLREAVLLYRGDLLEACYDEWVTDPRAHFRRRFVSALERLAALLAERSDYAAAIPHVERLLALDPLREDAYRHLMRLHDARGDRGLAVQVYQTCVGALERELGVEPSPATRETYEALLRGHSKRASPAAPAHDGDLPPAPPLVGRVAEWTRLTSLWRSVESGRTALLLVTGEAGVGKTRLVEELHSWVANRGAIVAQARSYSAEGELAYAPLVAWLRTPPIAQAVLRLQPERRATIAQLVPELRGGEPDRQHLQRFSEDEHRHRLFDAVATALLSSGAPLLLIADDVQWCDQETLRFIHYLTHRAASAPVLVAATARSEEMDRSPALSELITGVRTTGVIDEIALERLTRDATADLVMKLGVRLAAPEDTDALYRATEGNALFVIEAVRAGWRRGAPGGDTLTPKVQAVIASRLGRLSDAARDLVGVAATLGGDFTTELLVATSEAPEDTVARALDELWRMRIIRDQGEGVYDFSHDKIREVAYMALSPPRRRQIHVHAAQALKQHRRADPVTVSGQIASHYDRAGVVDEAVRWYEMAAEASQQRYASREAVRLLTRALELVRAGDVTPEGRARELAIHTAMLTPVTSVHGYSSRELSEVQRQATALARELRVDPPPQLLRSIAVASLARDDFDSARGCGEQLLQRGRADDDDTLVVEGDYVLGIAAFWSGGLDAARHHFEAAVSRYRTDRRRAHLLRYWLDPQVVCLSRLGNTLWLLGDEAAALRARDDALALAETIGHEDTLRTALVFATLLALDMRDVGGVRAYTAALEAGQTDHESRPTRTATETFRAFVRVLDGAIEPGLARLRVALQELSEGGHAPGQRGVTARLLMDAHAMIGDHRGRLEAADGLLAMGGASVLWEAEAHRARAESLAELGGKPEEVVAAFERAIAVARRQGALAFERRADESLAQYTAR
ncbi:MAG TPA: BTAD domain-containing putative transcriptional regulator [Gemmatimonadaceae bacterium]|nr:BTAD domain-containing putative transcriptional regulator [Gemmatimonadaceae bacterium]